MDKQVAAQVSCRKKEISSRSQAVDTRKEATSEARDHLITEVNKINVGTEATAFVFTAPLLEGEPEVQCPNHVQHTQLYLYNVTVMRDLTVETCSSHGSSTHLPLK